MHHLPEIAIIEPNTLTALGLRTILEELIPEAVIILCRPMCILSIRHFF